jgi:hypothetical protein
MWLAWPPDECHQQVLIVPTCQMQSDWQLEVSAQFSEGWTGHE